MECDHIWITNSGQGGTPQYVLNRMMSPVPAMPVKCSECSCRTWFTQEQWESIPVDDE